MKTISRQAMLESAVNNLRMPIVELIAMLEIMKEFAAEGGFQDNLDTAFNSVGACYRLAKQADDLHGALENMILCGGGST
jgi:hypothetical protein